MTPALGDGPGMVWVNRETAPSNANSATTGGGKIVKVQQQGTDMAFVLEGGKSLAVKLAEETSSVIMRDKAGAFAYAD